MPYLNPTISEAVSNIAYVPEYVSEDEERRLLTEIHACKAKWTQVSGRRLQNHGGVVVRGGLLPGGPVPQWLRRAMDRVSSERSMDPTQADSPMFGGPANHVLINAYAAGQGILPHEDGPLYHPEVAILSLGGPAVMQFYRNEGPGESSAAPAASVALLERSLLVFSGEAYSFRHGIDAAQADMIDESVYNAQACGLVVGDVLDRQGERVSLTIRRVLRTHKALLRL